MPTSKWESCDNKECVKCKGARVQCQTYEPFDEAYTDYHYFCTECEYDWWIEGCDS